VPARVAPEDDLCGVANGDGATSREPSWPQRTACSLLRLPAVQAIAAVPDAGRRTRPRSRQQLPDAAQRRVLSPAGVGCGVPLHESQPVPGARALQDGYALRACLVVETNLVPSDG
jgi:hypothetical protein